MIHPSEFRSLRWAHFREQVISFIAVLVLVVVLTVVLAIGLTFLVFTHYFIAAFFVLSFLLVSSIGALLFGRRHVEAVVIDQGMEVERFRVAVDDHSPPSQAQQIDENDEFGLGCIATIISLTGMLFGTVLKVFRVLKLRDDEASTLLQAMLLNDGQLRISQAYLVLGRRPLKQIVRGMTSISGINVIEVRGDTFLVCSTSFVKDFAEMRNKSIAG